MYRHLIIMLHELLTKALAYIVMRHYDMGFLLQCRKTGIPFIQCLNLKSPWWLWLLNSPAHRHLHYNIQKLWVVHLVPSISNDHEAHRLIVEWLPL